MAVGTRRSSLEIIRDILRMEQGGTAQLRYLANLSYPQLQRYLKFLEQSNLIKLDRPAPQITDFTVTDKGRRVLKLLEQLFLTLEANSLAEVEAGGARSR